MKLETILKAAVNSMVHGHHAPHCFSAHVVGQGYVNKGEFDRSDYLRQLERRATSEIENMGFARGYSEPGYENPKHAVLTADWNCLPRGLDTLLEKAGYAIEWSDEWTACDDCNNLVRTEPDGYDWHPSYTLINDSEIICHNCQPEEEKQADET